MTPPGESGASSPGRARCCTRPGRPCGQRHGVHRQRHHRISRKRVEQQLVHDALHDGLTGLPNRALFMDRLEHAIERDAPRRRCALRCSSWTSTASSWSTTASATGGRPAPDRVAERAAQVPAPGRHRRPAGRRRVHGPAGGLERRPRRGPVAERIHGRWATPFRSSGHEVFVSTSIGIALAQRYEPPEDCCATPTPPCTRPRPPARAPPCSTPRCTAGPPAAGLEAELRRAVEREEFAAALPAGGGARHGRLAGFEALLRWEHPERGLSRRASSSPGRGDRAHPRSATGCSPTHASRCRPGRRSRLRAQGQREHLEPAVLAGGPGGAGRPLLQESGLPASRMKLEITESVIMDERRPIDAGRDCASWASRSASTTSAPATPRSRYLLASRPTTQDRPVVRPGLRAADGTCASWRPSCRWATAWPWTWWPKASRPRSSAAAGRAGLPLRPGLPLLAPARPQPRPPCWRSRGSRSRSRPGPTSVPPERGPRAPAVTSPSPPRRARRSANG